MIVTQRQEEAKAFIAEQLIKLKPREMIRVVPKDQEAFTTFLDSPVHVQSYEQASKEEEIHEKYANLYGSVLKANSSLTVAKHYSRMQEVQYLIIKKGETKDIELAQVINQKHTESHLIIVIEEGATANIMQQLAENISAGVHDMFIEIIVQKGAKLQFTALQNAPVNTYLRYYRAIQVHADATVDVQDVLLGSEFQELVSQIYVVEKNAVGNQQATVFGNNQRYLITQQSHHLVGETKSDIATKAVLQNHAQAGFKGLVAIQPGASESEGYQQMDVLLLDESARASAIPELAIQTDIVSCSHGATIGELDEDQLFYLQARGMSKQEATHLLLIGFLSQGIAKLSEEQQEHIVRSVEKRLTV